MLPSRYGKIIQSDFDKDIASELPESAPRYIAYSLEHTHDDGRKSLPLVFIFYSPSDINPNLAMMYSR